MWEEKKNSNRCYFKIFVANWEPFTYMRKNLVRLSAKLNELSVRKASALNKKERKKEKINTFDFRFMNRKPFKRTLYRFPLLFRQL